MTSNRIRAYTYLLTVALIWGFAGIVIKVTLNEIAPLPFLTYRFGVASAFALLYILIYKPKLHIKFKNLFIIIFYSLLANVFALFFLFLGLQTTGILTLSLITLIFPLLVGISGVIFLHEHITHKEKIGTGIAVIGAFLTILEPILVRSQASDEMWGQVMILLYILMDVSSVVVLKKILRSGISPFILSNISFIVAFIVILPVTILLYPNLSLINTIQNLSFNAHAGVWYMALISGTVAYALRGKGQKSIEIGEGALFGYLQSVFSAPLAVLLLNEQITPLFVIGAIIIALGIYIAEKK